MIWLRILQTNGDLLWLFEPPLEESQIFDLKFSEFLDGIGTGQFSIRTWNEMRQYLQMNNIVEILDFWQNEKVIWRGWVRWADICNDVSTFRLNQTKDMLNNYVITSSWTVTSITEALQLIGLPYNLNQPDITFDGIEYRVGTTAYTLLEEIRKATDYNYDYDGFTITYGRLWRDRTDVGFTNTIKPSSCSVTEGEIYINNICASPTLQYDKVVAHSWNLFAQAGSWKIQVSISSDADNVTDLQSVANEYLERGLPWRVITFDVPNLTSWVLNLWDKIDVSIQWLDDSRNIDDEVFVLKTENFLDGCSVRTKLTVSETKVLIRDNYNVLNNIANKVQNLETK